jgi:hypothetical protein
MRRYRVEQAAVLMIGFLVGAGLANSVAPGDVPLSIVAGAFLCFFLHQQFVRSWGGELLWWRPHPRRHLPKHRV